MSLFQRLSRAIDTLSHVHLDERSQYGAFGENYAAQVITKKEGTFWIANPIIPHPSKPGFTRESDFLVYTQGNVFCIEIKHYKGKIFPKDDSTIIQEKMGNYGEGIFTNEHPNPLKKTKNFIYHLKNYVGQIEPRFQRLHIYAVAAFSEEADISAIHSFDDGMIYISELQRFFEHHRNPQFAQRPSLWIMNAMRRIPTWDLIQTTDNEWINGFFMTNELVYKGTDRRMHSLPYAKINSVSWQRKGLFSAYDEMTISFTDGKQEKLNSVNGSIWLQRIGEKKYFKLRNVNKLIVGVANKFI